MDATDLVFAQVGKPDYPLFWGDGELGIIERDSHDDRWWSRWTIDPDYSKATQSVYTVEGGWLCNVKEVTLKNNGTKDSPSWEADESKQTVQHYDRQGLASLPKYIPAVLNEGDVWKMVSNCPWDWHDGSRNTGTGVLRWTVDGSFFQGRITVHETWEQTNSAGVMDRLERLSAFDATGYLGFKDLLTAGKYGLVTRNGVS